MAYNHQAYEVSPRDDIDYDHSELGKLTVLKFFSGLKHLLVPVRFTIVSLSEPIERDCS